jgi:hypothetical protein
VLAYVIFIIQSGVFIKYIVIRGIGIGGIGIGGIHDVLIVLAVM